MNLSISTPALLFPAITLMMLAYTNRFLAIAMLIRNLRDRNRKNPNQKIVVGQILNLRKRLNMIRYMQVFGILSFFLTVVCMFLLFEEQEQYGNFFFVLSLLSLLVSLGISLVETQISTKALNLELSDMADD